MIAHAGAQLPSLLGILVGVVETQVGVGFVLLLDLGRFVAVVWPILVDVGAEHGVTVGTPSLVAGSAWR